MNHPCPFLARAAALFFALGVAALPAAAEDLPPDAPPAAEATAPAAAAAPEFEPAETKAPYRVDHDAPLKPAEQVDREAADHTRLRVEFNGIKADRVPAYLYLPKGNKAGAGKHPAVLLQYGSGGNKNTNYIVALGEQFVAKGFVVLTIDSPNKGERRPKAGGGGGLKGMFAERGQFPWYCGDYSRALDYLLTRPEVDPRRVGYAGISWGAITGIVFVAHEPRVKAMASIVGGGNWLGAIQGEVPEETRRISRKIDPVYHVKRIAPRPLLLLNVTKDQLVPRFFGESLHKAAGDGPSVKKMWVETDHFFNGIDRYAVLAEVIAFMEKSLPEAK